jgi:hypothetical protein
LTFNGQYSVISQNTELLKYGISFTPWSRVLLETLMFFHLIVKFHAIETTTAATTIKINSQIFFLERQSQQAILNNKLINEI